MNRLSVAILKTIKNALSFGALYAVLLGLAFGLIYIISLLVRLAYPLSDYYSLSTIIVAILLLVGIFIKAVRKEWNKNKGLGIACRCDNIDITAIKSDKLWSIRCNKCGFQSREFFAFKEAFDDWVNQKGE